jgi:hypothetical protein
MRNRFFVYALCVALLNLASPQAAQAALVGTLQAVEASGTRAQDLAIVNSALARTDGSHGRGPVGGRCACRASHRL